jgi:hypothetical protein
MQTMLQDALNGGKLEMPHPNVRQDMLEAMDGAVTNPLDVKISAQEAAGTGADKVDALSDQNGVTAR